jgi:hypothetical protein
MAAIADELSATNRGGIFLAMCVKSFVESK